MHEANRYQALPRIGESDRRSGSELDTSDDEVLRGPAAAGEWLDADNSELVLSCWRLGGA